MCLGMPAEVVGVEADRPDLATVEMNGTRHVVSVALLDADAVEPGSWVLVHLGFAMRRLSEEDARTALGVFGFATTGGEAGDDG